jgi:hypothetical protein
MNAADKIFDYMYRNRKTFQLILGLLVALFITVTELKAQDTEGFIYGKIYTSNNSYTGQIRWGREEAYWNDHFNASKVDNAYESFRRKERDRDRDFDWRLSSIWDDRSTKTLHIFSCQFGDLKEIINYGDKRVTVKLKNGKKIKLSGSGYNDVGSSLTVYDSDLGEMSIKWEKVTRVEFLPTPKDLKDNFGKPMYGVVQTYRKGRFEGFVQWDHDERIGADKLDGETRDGDVSIPFDRISRIEKVGNGSLVNLKSGREYRVTGTNDVDNSNKGIIVSIEKVGKVDITWKEFKSVTFTEVTHSGAAYHSYAQPKPLTGTVFSYDDQQLSGEIVFDVDEAWDLEMLEGKDDDVEYKIPFRNIKSIEPKNYNYSTIKLRNGQELLLGNSRDVSDDNAGVLVLRAGQKELIHIDWKKIIKIEFE